MEFLGRSREISLLEREYARGRSFVAVYGRRRIGKTRLLKQFIREKKALYFLASRENEALNRQRFAQMVGSFVGLPELAENDNADWRLSLRLFADFHRDETKILIIDELPYLMEANPAFPSILQYAWDELLQDANVMLVVCGSSTHMMEEGVLESTSPLYGRTTAQIKLKELPFDDAREGFEEYSFEDQMRMYAITGGVPKYMEFFHEAQIDEAICTNLLSTSGFLYNEPRFLLAQDTRNPITHYSILRAIAYGKHRLSEIAAMLEKPQTEVSPYLKILERLGYVERQTPATEKAPERSKNGLYRISDGLLSFWFTYVLPYEGDIELGNCKPSQRAIATSFDERFVAQAFEGVSRQTLARLCQRGEIPFEPNRIGAYWNRKNTIEIDVCATSSDNAVPLLGECKYHESRPFSRREHAALVEKARLLLGDDADKAILCLFSKTGFDEEILTLPERGDTLFLIDRNQLL